MVSSIVIIYSLFYCSCLSKIQELFFNILIIEDYTCFLDIMNIFYIYFCLPVTNLANP